MSRRLALLSAAAVAGLAVSTTARAQVPVIDGTRDAVYGAPFAVQTVNTGFGDNQSEIDAGYVNIQGGKMYMMLTGNLETNFNKLVFFFDTRAGGQNVMRTDNPDVEFNNLNFRYGGMTHDAGFEPDYIMWLTRNFNGGTNEFEIFANFSELNTNGGGFGGFVGQLNSPTQQMSGSVGGSGGSPLLEIGYDDSNTAGVIGDGVGAAADQTAAAAVTTGMEFAIELPQLGALEDFEVMVGVNGSSHDFWSNQFLPGLTPPQFNLGSDGLGNFVEPGGPGTGGTVGLVNFNNIAGNQFLTINYSAPESEWNDGNGNWSQAGFWTGDGVPNAIDARAILGTLGGGGARTITLDTNVRLQSITFDNAAGYTIAPSGNNTLTIAGNPATPSVVVNSGTHSIGAPVVLGATTNMQVAASSQLSITGSLTATGQTLVKTGAGNLVVPQVQGNRLDVQEGLVRVAPNGTVAGTSNVQSLALAGGATPTATLDLTNNAMVVDYADGGESPLPGLLEQIIYAYNAGGTRREGITTSSGSAYGVGYAEASAFGGSVPAIFGTVDTSAVLMRGTRYGDANLDGTVNLSDFNALASNFGLTDKDWIEGDFNYDNTVNLADFNLLAGNFGLSASPEGPTAGDWAALAAAVPEPGSATVLGVATLVAMSRTRRRR